MEGVFGGREVGVGKLEGKMEVGSCFVVGVGNGDVGF